MTDAPTASLLAGLIAFSPIIGQGLIPSSYEGMTRRPLTMFPYSAAGAMMVLIFSSGGWLVDRHLIQPLHLHILALTIWLLMLWLLGTGLRLLLNASGLVLPQLAYFSTSCLALGCGLVVMARVRTGFAEAALASLGMALGFLVTNVLIAYIRERIETPRTPKAIRGWPMLLIICSVLWLALSGIELLVH